VEPGLLALKRLGKGRIIVCRLPIDRKHGERARVKALRFHNILLANLGAPRNPSGLLLDESRARYVDAAWEDIPPFINW